MRLESLVRETNDPWVISYAIAHLGEGVPPQSTYATSIRSWRAQLSQHLMRLVWDPLSLLPRTNKTLSANMQQLKRMQMEAQRRRWMVEHQAALNRFLQAYAKEVAK